MSKPKLYTTKQAYEFLEISRSTFLRWVKDGKISPTEGTKEFRSRKKYREQDLLKMM